MGVAEDFSVTTRENEKRPGYYCASYSIPNVIFEKAWFNLTNR